METQYLESLKGLAALDPQVLCAGHHAVFTELNAPAHIQQADCMMFILLC